MSGFTQTYRIFQVRDRDKPVVTIVSLERQQRSSIRAPRDAAIVLAVFLPVLQNHHTDKSLLSPPAALQRATGALQSSEVDFILLPGTSSAAQGRRLPKDRSLTRTIVGAIALCTPMMLFCTATMLLQTEMSVF